MATRRYALLIVALMVASCLAAPASGRRLLQEQRTYTLIDGMVAGPSPDPTYNTTADSPEACSALCDARECDAWAYCTADKGEECAKAVAAEGEDTTGIPAKSCLLTTFSAEKGESAFTFLVLMKSVEYPVWVSGLPTNASEPMSCEGAWANSTMHKANIFNPEPDDMPTAVPPSIFEAPSAEDCASACINNGTACAAWTYCPSDQANGCTLLLFEDLGGASESDPKAPEPVPSATCVLSPPLYKGRDIVGAFLLWLDSPLSEWLGGVPTRRPECQT